MNRLVSLAALSLSLAACTDVVEQPPPTAEERLELGVTFDVVDQAIVDETELSLDALRSDARPAPLPGTLGPRRADAEDADRISQVIWGTDTRTRVTPVDGFPELARVRIAITWPLPGLEGSSCTGAMIGNRYVLTAGHCVYQGEKGGWGAQIKIYAGQDGSALPALTANAIRTRTVTAWTEDEDNDYDYALLTLDRSLGTNTGWYGLAALTDTQLDTTNAYIYGYPGDKPRWTMWGDDGPVETYDSTMVYYDVDTFDGESGAGVYRWMNDHRFVFAVHTGMGWSGLTPYNVGTRINAARFNQILAWMATGT